MPLTFQNFCSILLNNNANDCVIGEFENLSEHGQVFMPLSRYPFSDKYGWLSDKYGVSWQLSLRRS